MAYISMRIIVLACLFIFGNFILWYPWIKAEGMIGVQKVAARIFPVRRGIFEDKVATFWCVLHNFYKVNTLLDRNTQLMLTTATTLFFCIPSLWLLFRRPSDR